MINVSEVQFSRVRELPGLELYRTADVVRSVPRHIHWVFSLSICEAGVGVQETKQGKQYLTPGSLVVVQVGDTHAGGVPSGYTYSSRSIRIDPALLGVLLLQMTGRQQETLRFQQPVIIDRELSRQIYYLHSMLEQTTSRLEKECCLLDTLAKLYDRHSRSGLIPALIGNESTRISRVCEYLQDCCNENVSLEQLSSVAGLSAFHLSRVFKKEVGVPPHAYQLQVRLKKATDLLAAGKPLAEAAFETGFCDQSHFQKAFKRKFGISPGQYKY